MNKSVETDRRVLLKVGGWSTFWGIPTVRIKSTLGVSRGVPRISGNCQTYLACRVQGSRVRAQGLGTAKGELIKSDPYNSSYVARRITSKGARTSSFWFRLESGLRIRDWGLAFSFVWGWGRFVGALSIVRSLG